MRVIISPIFTQEVPSKQKMSKKIQKKILRLNFKIDIQIEWISLCIAGIIETRETFDRK